MHVECSRYIKRDRPDLFCLYIYPMFREAHGRARLYSGIAEKQLGTIGKVMNKQEKKRERREGNTEPHKNMVGLRRVHGGNKDHGS